MTEMKHFPDGIEFCFPWRSYQQRILNELDYHLRNEHLHLVAPPGSGKTVLGLEVMLRLNQPTIILAPTLTIKNQWESRFTELFLQADEKPDWISMNIKSPAFVTVTTYQALFSLYRTYQGETDEAIVEEVAGQKEKIETSEAQEIFDKIAAINFKTIVLDEAHHLRTAWWKATKAFRENMKEPTVVALTATPPYDTTVQEWDKYEDLCGPIDAEIHVAELVRANDLCPHQDYIYLSTPQREEKKQLKKFHKEVKKFMKEMAQSEELIAGLKAHPWIQTPTEYTETILNQPSYFSSMLIFLHHVDEDIALEARKVMGIKKKKLPAFDQEYAEILVNHIFKDEFYEDESRIDLSKMKKELKRIGAMERGKVYLRSTPEWDKKLVHSASKFNSIEKIVQLENEIMGEDLRMVILTDYIRKEAFTQLDGGKDFTNKLGVVPIFQLLRINLDRSFPLAILTGSLIVIPKAIEKELLALAEARDVAVTYKTLPQDDAFMSLNVTQSNRSEIVAIMTDLLSAGHIRLVVGTAALLGEGWDAPCVNTLIMASYVGSFMLSNQMRGRAIRIDPEVKDKTGAIWHLGCVDDDQYLGGHDIFSLSRRFRSLVGLNVEDDLVETGLHRMGDIFHSKFTKQKVTAWNRRTIELAKNRKQLDGRWQKAVSDEDASQQIQLRMPKKTYIKPFYFKNTIRALFMAALTTFLFVLANGANIFTGGRHSKGTYIVLLIVIVIAILAALPKTIKAIMLAVRYASVENFIEDVGKMLYETLYELELVETAPKDVLVKMKELEGGYVATIYGATTYEKNVYLKALQELLEPIDNPRYLLCRQPKRRFLLKPKPDYHTIPEEIARRKEDATLFAEKWSKKFDPATAIYTRSPEGRSILVKSRLASLSSKFVDKSEQISVWQ